MLPADSCRTNKLKDVLEVEEQPPPSPVLLQRELHTEGNK